MLKKAISMLVTVLLLNLALAPAAFAKTEGNSKEVKFIEKLRANLQNQGVGVNSKINLKLKDGTKINGYVSEIKADEFVVVNENTGQNNNVPYPQVKQAKGNNWSQKQWIGLIAVAGLIVFVFVAVATAKD
jgi:regulatory protein YycI of two-component signal transduction system YycFG